MLHVRHCKLTVIVKLSGHFGTLFGDLLWLYCQITFESLHCDGWWQRLWQEVSEEFNTLRYQWQSPVKHLAAVCALRLANGGDAHNSALQLALHKHKCNCTHTYTHTGTRLWSPSNSFVPLGAMRWPFLLLSLFMWRVDHHVRLCVSACAQTLATRLFKVHLWVRMQACVCVWVRVCVCWGGDKAVPGTKAPVGTEP